MCERLEDYGNSLNCARPPHLFGGWSEYMYLLPGTQLFRVPDALPDHVAVLTEPMAVTHGFDRARRLNDTFAETVVVYGVGPLGMCHLIKARLMGAGKLIAIDRFRVRLEPRRDFGADEAARCGRARDRRAARSGSRANRRPRRRHRPRLQRRAGDVCHQPADGARRRHGRRGRRVRRHGSGRDQPQRRHLQP